MKASCRLPFPYPLNASSDDMMPFRASSSNPKEVPALSYAASALAGSFAISV
jgi:hypothetical protein